MIQNSIVVKLFKKLSGFVCTMLSFFNVSFIYKLVCGIADGIAHTFEKGVSHRILSSKGPEKYSEGSALYRFNVRAIDALISFSGKIFDFMSEVYSSSILSKVCRFTKNTVASSVFGRIFGKGTDVYVGFFGFIIAVMFCVPHSFWNNLLGLGIALLSVIWVLYGCHKNKDNIVIRPDRTYLSIIYFFACLVLSTVLSRSRSDSIRILMFFVTSILLCLTISVFTSKKSSFRSFCGMLFACVTVTGVVGIVQAILKVEADSSLTDLTLNANMPGRVFSTMGNPNNFAQMLVLFMPYCAAFALTAKTALKKTVLCALLAIPLVALLQTYSRSGWIAFAVAVAVFVALVNRRLIPALIIICIAAVPFLPSSVLDRILTIGNMQDSSSSYRILIWEGAREMLGLVWTVGLGIGPGAFKSVYPAYARGSTQDVAHCHMQFMEVFLETGILGFIGFIWMTVSLIRRAFIATSSKDKELKYYAAAASASMTSIVFIGFFEYYWFYPRVMFSFFVSAGLAVAVYRMWQNEKENGEN